MKISGWYSLQFDALVGDRETHPLTTIEDARWVEFDIPRWFLRTLWDAGKPAVEVSQVGGHGGDP